MTLNHHDTEECVVTSYGAIPPAGEPDWPLLAVPHPDGGICALRVVFHSLHIVGVNGFIMANSLPPYGGKQIYRRMI